MLKEFMRKVSVIIPIYNAENYLHLMMNSLLNQTFTDFEVLAVDDASTDATQDILNEYIRLFYSAGIDFNVIKRETNGGLCAAINNGIRASHGEYLCFPDADDELNENYISAMLETLDNTEFKWVRCDYTIVLDEEKREYDVILPKKSVYENDFFDFISKYVAHNVWNMMVEREYFFNCIGNEIIDSRLTQEWSMLLPLSYKSNYERCGKKLYKYHIRKAAMSSWQMGDIGEVIKHVNGLESLNLEVINSIKFYDHEKARNSVDAIKLYYDLFRYKVYKRNEDSMADYYENLVKDIAENYLGHTICDRIVNPDICVRLVFDVLLKADCTGQVENYRKYANKTKQGYCIAYDTGGLQLVQDIQSIYGKADKVFSHVDKAEPEMHTVIGLIENSKEYAMFKSKNVHLDDLLEYREVRDSIRGWAVEMKNGHME